jgi:hypothetical protein
MSYGEALMPFVDSQLRVDPAQMSCGVALMPSVDSQMQVDRHPKPFARFPEEC